MRTLPAVLFLFGLPHALADPAPDWFRHNLERMTDGSGTWIAANDDYRSADEPFVSYGMRWSPGIGDLSARGELFGIHENGEQPVFWQFLMFWHPGENRAYVQQFGGDGTVGIGTLEPSGENRDRLVQTFFSPDGSTAEVGHETEHGDRQHEGVSFDIAADGTWLERRRYQWVLQADEPRPALPITEGFVTADDGTRLYYVESGASDSVLIAPVALYLAPHLLQPLSRNHRVIFYDPRNRGRSEAADLATVSLDQQVEDLEALRSDLGIEDFALLGWSGLGMEMAVYALRYPQHVTRLIQMSAVPPAAAIMREAGDDRNNRVDVAVVNELDRRADAGEFDERPQAYCRERNALTDPANFVDVSLVDEVPDVCRFENEWPVNLWPFISALLGTFGDYDWRPDLHDLDIPRLVIHGREDGIPIAGAVAWVQGYGNARLLELSPAGHFPFIEKRHEVVTAIESFLNGRWPEGAVSVPAADN